MDRNGKPPFFGASRVDGVKRIVVRQHDNRSIGGDGRGGAYEQAAGDDQAEGGGRGEAVEQMGWLALDDGDQMIKQVERFFLLRLQYKLPKREGVGLDASLDEVADFMAMAEQVVAEQDQGPAVRTSGDRLVDDLLNSNCCSCMSHIKLNVVYLIVSALGHPGIDLIHSRI